MVDAVLFLTTHLQPAGGNSFGFEGMLSTTAVHVGNMSIPGTTSTASAIASLHWKPTASKMMAAVSASSAMSNGDAAPSDMTGKKPTG